MPAVPAKRGAEFLVLFGRDVDADHTVHAGVARGGGEPVRAPDRHRIGIAHQDQWRVRVAGTRNVARDVQDIGGFGARGEAAQVRGLNGGAVGHRIGERHTQFDHVRAAFDQCVEDRGGGAGRRGRPP